MSDSRKFRIRPLDWTDTLMGGMIAATRFCNYTIWQQDGITVVEWEISKLPLDSGCETIDESGVAEKIALAKAKDWAQRHWNTVLRQCLIEVRK